MPNFAIIQDNKVVNAIVADSLEDVKEMFKYSDCLEITDDFKIGINWEYDGSNWFNPRDLESGGDNA